MQLESREFTLRVSCGGGRLAYERAELLASFLSGLEEPEMSLRVTRRSETHCYGTPTSFNREEVIVRGESRQGEAGLREWLRRLSLSPFLEGCETRVGGISPSG